MRIGFDAKRALNNTTGLGNHARILLNALMREYPEHAYELFSPKVRDTLFNELVGDFKMILPDKSRRFTLSPSLWRSWGLTRDLIDERVDIYHGLSNELPFNIHQLHIKKVVTIHDLIFLKHTEQYPFIDRQFYKLKTQYAAKHADKIIAVSKETKQDLINFYAVPEKKIEVIYPSVDPAFYQIDVRRKTIDVRQLYGLPEKYILNVGSFFPRKNQQTLIEAFDIIKDKVEEDVVLISSGGTTLKHIKELIARKNLSSRVKIIAGVLNADLPAIYRAASAFVFPSLFEGFGAPVLEALFTKVPVIATKGAAIEEAGGRSSIYIDPTNAEEIADALLKVLKDGALRAAMIEKGYAHAQTMTDTVFAEKTMGIYEQVFK